MKAAVQKEHLWLQKLNGDWTFEAECSMGPDQPPHKSTGTQTVRSLGGLWSICEGDGEAPDGSKVKSIIRSATTHRSNASSAVSLRRA